MTTTRPISLHALLFTLTATTAACGPVPEEGDDSDPASTESGDDGSGIEITEQDLACTKGSCDNLSRAAQGLFEVTKTSHLKPKWDQVGKTIFTAFAGAPHHVSMAERKQICAATGGFGPVSVAVSPCFENRAVVIPNGLPGQNQPCNEGQGHHYTGPQCVYKDHEGLYFFDDGPSVPIEAEAALPPRFFTGDDARYAMLFWPAGQEHDYCYHHTITYPFKNRGRCDLDFKGHMERICEKNYRGILGVSFNRFSCKQAAGLMYEAVAGFGQDAFRSMKTLVHYAGRPYTPPPVTGSDNGECDVMCPPGTEKSKPPACGCEPI